MYTDMTAAQLADEIDQITRLPAEHAVTGWVSLLDEATLAYQTTMPGTRIAEAQKAFGDASYAHKRSYKTERGDYDPAKWAVLQDAARNLAAELRQFGDHRIARCKEQSGWGVCNLPLRENGTCGLPNEHLSAKATGR